MHNNVSREAVSGSYVVMRHRTGVVLTRQTGLFHVNIARDKWQTVTTQAGVVISDRVPQARVGAETLTGLCSVY